LPAALIALRARVHLRSPAGARSLDASEFFLGPLYTAREADELLVEVEVPEQPEGSGSGFAEHARTHGDFATAGAAAIIAPGYAGIALLGGGPVPARAEAAEQALAAGAAPREAAALAAQDVEGGHRKALCTELARRAIEEAMA
jgi:carbon-monoxide dehydrogenase medium subunit